METFPNTQCVGVGIRITWLEKNLKISSGEGGGGWGGGVTIRHSRVSNQTTYKNKVSKLWIHIYVVKKKNSVDKSITCRTSKSLKKCLKSVNYSFYKLYLCIKKSAIINLSFNQPLTHFIIFVINYCWKVCTDYYLT